MAYAFPPNMKNNLLQMALSGSSATSLCPAEWEWEEIKMPDRVQDDIPITVSRSTSATSNVRVNFVLAFVPWGYILAYKNSKNLEVGKKRRK